MSTNRSLLTLPIGGLLYTAGVVMRGPFADPTGKVEEFVERASTGRFPLAYLVIMAASGVTTLGYVALRDRLPGALGRTAMIVSIIGLHFLAAFFGVMAITYPAAASAYLAGNHDAVGIAARAVSSPTTMAVMALVSLNVLGHLLFAIAIWKSRSLPRGAALPFVLAPIMQLIPWIYPVEILGCVLMFVAGAWIAATATRSVAV